MIGKKRINLQYLYETDKYTKQIDKSDKINECNSDQCILTQFEINKQISNIKQTEINKQFNHRFDRKPHGDRSSLDDGGEL